MVKMRSDWGLLSMMFMKLIRGGGRTMDLGIRRVTWGQLKIWALQVNRWSLNLWSEECEKRGEPMMNLQGNQNKQQAARGRGLRSETEKQPSSRQANEDREEKGRAEGRDKACDDIKS